jgi:large subunit ribosomal protein L21
MYAVIRAGGKQYKVAKGDVIEIEKVKDSGEKIEFTPLVIVDDKGKSTAGPSALSKAKVTAKVVGATKGPKVDVAKHRNKTGYRRNTGHRQQYSTVEISDIKL